LPDRARRWRCVALLAMSPLTMSALWLRSCAWRRMPFMATSTACARAASPTTSKPPCPILP
ncbi:hypothetical protein GGF44_006744, partial [Coemansia sp. RSA 1694]